MDHYQATELTAVEKYLLDELTPGERDDFEEHFFDCQECATDLRATAAFMAAAKKEFQGESGSETRRGHQRQIVLCLVLAIGAGLVCACGLSSGDRISEHGRLSALQNRNCTS